MNNTALRAGAQSADNTHMVFANKEHEKFYYEKLEQGDIGTAIMRRRFTLLEYQRIQEIISVRFMILSPVVSKHECNQASGEERQREQP